MIFKQGIYQIKLFLTVCLVCEQFVWLSVFLSHVKNSLKQKDKGTLLNLNMPSISSMLQKNQLDNSALFLNKNPPKRALSNITDKSQDYLLGQLNQTGLNDVICLQQKVEMIPPSDQSLVFDHNINSGKKTQNNITMQKQDENDTEDLFNYYQENNSFFTGHDKSHQNSHCKDQIVQYSKNPGIYQGESFIISKNPKSKSISSELKSQENENKPFRETPVLLEIHIITETFYLLNEVINYKSKSLDKNSGIAKSIQHFAKAYQTFKILSNSYGKAISLINIGYFQLAQASQITQTINCCGFPCTRLLAAEGERAIESLDSARMLVLQQLGIENLRQLSVLVETGCVSWASEQEFVLLQCLRSILMMKGRFFRDCSFPCSPQHLIDAKDMCLLIMASTLLKLAMRLSSFCAIKTKDYQVQVLLATDILELDMYLNRLNFSQNHVFQRQLSGALGIQITSEADQDQVVLLSSQYLNYSSHSNSLRVESGESLVQIPKGDDSIITLHNMNSENNFLDNILKNRYEMIISQRKLLEPGFNPTAAADRQPEKHSQFNRWLHATQARALYLSATQIIFKDNFTSFQNSQNSQNLKFKEILRNILENCLYIESRILRKSLRLVCSSAPVFQKKCNELDADYSRRFRQFFEIILVLDLSEWQYSKDVSQAICQINNSLLIDQKDRLAVISFNKKQVSLLLMLTQQVKQRNWNLIIEEVQKVYEQQMRETKLLSYQDNNYSSLQGLVFLPTNLKKNNSKESRQSENNSNYYPRNKIFHYQEVKTNDSSINDLTNRTKMNIQPVEMYNYTKDNLSEDNYHNRYNTQYSNEESSKYFIFRLKSAIELGLRQIPQLKWKNQPNQTKQPRDSSFIQRRVLVIVLSGKQQPIVESEEWSLLSNKLSSLKLHTSILQVRVGALPSPWTALKNNQSEKAGDSNQEHYQFFGSLNEFGEYFQFLRLVNTASDTGFQEDQQS